MDEVIGDTAPVPASESRQIDGDETIVAAIRFGAATLPQILATVAPLTVLRRDQIAARLAGLIEQGRVIEARGRFTVIC